MPIERRSDLGANFVRAVFDYCNDTGQLFWRDGEHLLPHVRSRFLGKAAGSRSRVGYVCIKVCGSLYRAHRLVWLHVHGSWPAGEIDHIDGNKQNNRIENLRVASRSENMRNVSAYSSNKAGAKGVSFDPASGKWRAQITLNRRTRTLGRFNTIEAAHEAYRLASENLHGSFSRAA